MLRIKIAIATVLAGLTLGALASAASARMRSTKLDGGVCLTEGGGRFVDIPGFPGETIDRRLLRDIEFLERRYKIFVTDGYSNSGVHAPNGEHPIGLALDIAPNKSQGGSWTDIDALAAWAEPRESTPISPFRWVGYDGDAGHGRGHHLHLSWNHSATKAGTPAESVYTLKCPKPGGARKNGNGGGKPNKPSPPNGGTEASTPGPSGDSGGVEPRLSPVVVETAGVEG